MLSDRAWESAHWLLRWGAAAVSDTRLRVSDSGGLAALSHTPVIIAGNHLNVLDGCIIRAAMPRETRQGTRFVTSHEIRERWERPNARQRVQRRMFAACYRPLWTGNATVAAMIDALRGGDRVVILPEGDYWVDGALHPLRIGVAVAAIETCSRIVPVRIEGSAGLGGTLRGHHRLHVQWRAPIDVAANDRPVDVLTRLKQALAPSR